jgi:hypothetical protein
MNLPFTKPAALTREVTAVNDPVRRQRVHSGAERALTVRNADKRNRSR